MDMSTLIATTLQLVRENGTLVEVVLFVLGFAESIVLFSFFIPASALFLAIGGLQGAGGGHLLTLVVAGTVGAFLGDLVSYWIGWRYRDSLHKTWPFRSNPEWIPSTKRFFEKWGIAGIVVAKFIGPMRPLVPTISGAVSMPHVPFVAASIVSSFVWALVFLVPTFYGIEWLTR